MTLDQIQSIQVASSTSKPTHLYRPSDIFGSSSVTLDTTRTSPQANSLTIMKTGAKGWDAAPVNLKTRYTAAGEGEIATSYKLKGRRVTLKLSERVGEPDERDDLLEHVDPFARSILKMNYTSTSGKAPRYMIYNRYAGGMDRSDRHSSGRSQFDINFFSPWGYFVDTVYPSALAFSPQGVGQCVWGIRLAKSSGITDFGINISTSGTTTQWLWFWNPPYVGVMPPRNALGANAPREIIACFSSPFEGVWGRATAGSSAVEDDVSAGRVYGVPMPPYLTPGEPVVITVIGSGLVATPWYLRNYPSI